jgi:hypothetical protein
MKRTFQEPKNEVRSGAFRGQLDVVNALTLYNYFCTESLYLFLRHALFCVPATFNDDKTLFVFPNTLRVDLPTRTARSMRL